MDLDNSPSKPNEAYKMIVSKAQFLNKLAKQKSEDVQKIFSPMFAQIDGFESRYLEIVSQVEKFGITDQLIKKAKRLRLDLRPIRTTAEAERTREKAEYLVAGKAIDEASKAVQNVVKEKEEVLLGIEKYHENIEKQRVKNLQDERVEMLSEFDDFAFQMDLGVMEQEVFDAFFRAKEKAYNDAIETEKKAEAERVAKEKKEAEEREAQRLENAKLKAEAIERERLVKIETDKRLKAEAELKAKADAEIQAEIKAKTQAKEKAKQPLKIQFSDWIRNFELPNPPADTHEAREILAKFESFKAWAQREIQNS